MSKAIIAGVVFGLVASAAVMLPVLRRGPDPVAPPPIPVVDSNAELNQLRADVAQLQSQVAQLQERARPKVDEPQSRPQQQAEFKTFVASVDRRFAALLRAFQQQPRDEAWATQQERELRAVPSSHDYFRGTTFDSVACRTSWCRVLARHEDASSQDLFKETFTTFAPGFSNAALHGVTDANPLRTEVFLSRAGPLPR